MSNIPGVAVMIWLRSFVMAVCCASLVQAADWPHRFGPYRNSTTPEIVAPWTAALRPEWQMPLGEGYSSPTVAEGRLFLHAKVKDKHEEEVLALDAVTGKLLWKVSYEHKPFESNVGNGPRAAPVIARGRVYAYGITGILTCLDAETGKQFWQLNPLEQNSASIMMFGASAGPLVEGNRIFLPVGGRDSALVALDTESGATIWKSLNDPPTSVTPTLFLPKVEGRGIVRQLIYTSTRGLIGVDPKDGHALWQFPLADLAIGTLPPPIVFGDTILCCSMLTGSIAFKLQDVDEQLKPVEVWRNPQITTYFTQNLAGADDKLYVLHATLIPQADIALACLDAKTGKQAWQQPKIGLYQLNMIRTGDDKLLMLDDTHGDLILLDTAAAGYRELARGKVCNPTIISPALANGRLYVRDDVGVSCYQLSGGK
jgi:outer membrane protein assembly factor BamB